MRKFLLMSVAIAAWSITGNSWAQVELIPQPSPGDEIITIAERKPRTDRSRYPASIEVLTGEDLLEIAPVHMVEVLNQTPGVHIHRGSGLEHLTSIRSPILTGGAGAGSFLYLQDGIPLRSAGFSNVNGLFEAHHEGASKLETFLGPGNVVHGSNALHGLINFDTFARAPRNNYAVLIGEDGHVSGTIEKSVGEHKARLSLTHDNGFRDDSGYDQQKFTFETEKQHLPINWDLTWQISVQNLNQETAGFIRGDDAYLDDDIRFTNPNPEAYRDSRSVRSHLKLEKHLGPSNDLVVTPYMRWTDMEFLRHFVPGQATEKVGHWSIGNQAAWYKDNLIVGADMEFTQGYLDEFQAGPSVFSFVQGEHYDYEVDAVTLAGFGQYEIELGPRTGMTIGARAEYVGYDYNNLIDTADVGRFRRIGDRSDDFFIITPKLTLEHDFRDGLYAYARAVRGARAPQVTDLYSLQTQQQPGEIDSETLDSLEVGIKKRGGRLNFELAAYAMEKKNFFFRNSAGLNVVNGKTSHRGLEVAASWTPVDGLELSGNLNLADHTYNFSDAASSPSNTITDGNKVDTAPELFGTGKIKLSPFDRFSTELEWRHLGEYFLDPGNTQTYPGHDVFVLRGQYEFTEGHTFFARVDNLFDIRYANRADFAFGSERYFPGRPRTIFIGLRGEF